MEWMIYGAYGYTGELIAREAKRRGGRPILAGRSAARIASLSRELELPSRVFSLETPSAVVDALRGVRLVLNCAGPFSHTAFVMMRAALAANTHYLDITGEIDILEGVHGLGAEAKAAGVVLCPGVGFDVVPTDCIALMLKKAMPDAVSLALGFDTADREMSAGTAKTLIEALGKGGKIRRGGRLADCPLGSGLRRIDFGRGEKLAMPIPWGDIASAFYTAGIPDITVYAPVSPLLAALARLTPVLAFILRPDFVQKRIMKVIGGKIKGPNEEARAAGRSWLWGEARSLNGESREIRILTLNGYALTVHSALASVRYLLEHECPAGSWTPAALMGESLILSLPGTSLLNTPPQAA